MATGIGACVSLSQSVVTGLFSNTILNFHLLLVHDLLGIWACVVQYLQYILAKKCVSRINNTCQMSRWLEWILRYYIDTKSSKKNVKFSRGVWTIFPWEFVKSERTHYPSSHLVSCTKWVWQPKNIYPPHFS